MICSTSAFSHVPIQLSVPTANSHMVVGLPETDERKQYEVQ